MYKLFLCTRYLLKRRIAFFAVAAVTLCTAMVLIVISVMGGFLDMVKERSRGLLADLIVDNYSLQGFPFYQEFVDQILTDMPDVVRAATPVVYNYGTLRFPDGITKPVYLVGVRLEEAYVTNEFKQSLYYEKHYPGTTTLAEQKQPVFGFDDELIPRLPAELELALEKAVTAKDSAADEADRTPRLEREARAAFPGPGFYGSPLFLTVVHTERFARDFRTFAEDLIFQLGQPPDQRDPEYTADWLDEFEDDVPDLLERAENADLQPEDLGHFSTVQAALGRLRTAIQQDNLEQIGEQLDAIMEAVSILIESLRDKLAPGYIGTELPGIIIGRDMIGRPLEGSDYDRYYPRGERVIITMLPFSRKGAIAPSGAVSKAMRYVDDSRYGVYEIDSRNVYFDFDLAQQWLGMGSQRLDEELSGGMTPPRATQIQIKLAEGVDARNRLALEEAAVRVQEAWFGLTQRISDRRPPGVTDEDIDLMSAATVETWQDRQRQYIAAVEKEKVLVTILFAIISVVAVFLVGCTFYMIVQQKTRDIGIIKSMGATSAGVASIFISYGLLVGVVGSLVGLLFGAVFVHYINEIQDALAALNPNLRVWSRETYSFDYIPNTVKAGEAAVIVIVAIISSILGSLVPAWRASRVWPVEALRYE
ncbi:MAG: FtsX-like permease family protein [Phycisphaerales bacterium]|nr:MAG: FtsX-like permease family protein [Phycisphaerales bacterium]